MRPARINLLSFSTLLVGLSGAITAETNGAGLPVDEDAEARLLEFAGESFKIRRTPHFLVCYNSDLEVVNEFIHRVEATYAGVLRFLSVNNVEHAEPQARLEVFFFAEHDQFHEYAARIGLNVSGAGGFYDPKTNRAAFYNAISMPRLQELNQSIDRMQETLRQGLPRGTDKTRFAKELRTIRNQRDRMIEGINQTVVQHEVAHHVLFNTGVHPHGVANPKWLIEALACLFETPPGASGSGLGTTNQYRLVNLRTIMSPTGDPAGASLEGYEQACQQRRLAPLMQLVADGSLYDTSRVEVEGFYAQAWSLAFYLQRHHREKFGEYINKVAKRPPDKKLDPVAEMLAFEEVFGPLDKNFESRWLAFVLDLRYSRKPL